MNTKTLILFLALTFGLTWGLAALVMLFPEPLTAIFGEVSYNNPLFILAVYSPAFAAVILVLRQYGWRGLGSFFRRLTLWRAPLVGWLLLVAGIPVMFYAGAAIQGNLDQPFPFSPWTSALPALAMTLFIGPIEEFGWRGLALPLLQRRFAPFWSGLFLGLIWAVWHIPSFLIEGTPQNAFVFVPFFIAVISISVVLTPLFNAARGSLLVACLYHFQLNNPIFPDAQPWDMIFFVLAAVVIVVVNRKTMFQKGAGATDVLMPGDEEALEKTSPEQRPALAG